MATDETISLDPDSYECVFVCSICSEISTDSVCKNDHSCYKQSNNRSIPPDSTHIDYENFINSSILSTSALEQSRAEKIRVQRELEANVRPPTNGKFASRLARRKSVKFVPQTYVCPECGNISAELECKNDHTVDIPEDVCDRCNVSFDTVEELMQHNEDPTSCRPPLIHYFIPFHDVQVVSLADSKQIFYKVGKPIVLSLPENFASMVQKGTLGMGQYQVVAGYPDAIKEEPSFEEDAEIVEWDDTMDVTDLDWKEPVDEIPPADDTAYSKEIQAPIQTGIKVEPNLATQKVTPRTYPHCVVCNLDFISIDSLITHCVSHGEPLDFQCQFCLRHYNRAYWFKSHLKNHALRLPLVCHFCDESFLVAEQHRDHLQNAHGLDEAGAQQLLRSYSDDQFICMVCGRWYKSKMLLELHLQVHHPTKETNSKATASQSPATSSTLPDTPKKVETKKPIHVFECNICSATIKSIEEVRRHLSEHARSHMYKCEACNGRFLSPKHLQDHKCATTSEATRVQRQDMHKCAKCDKVFNHAAGLACHVKTHSEDRSEGFSCEKCPLKFKILSSYLIHRAQSH